jgi:hypothetical protein
MSLQKQLELTYETMSIEDLEKLQTELINKRDKPYNGKMYNKRLTAKINLIIREKMKRSGINLPEYKAF